VEKSEFSHIFSKPTFGKSGAKVWFLLRLNPFLKVEWRTKLGGWGAYEVSAHQDKGGVRGGLRPTVAP
jgi:hypothetical protein